MKATGIGRPADKRDTPTRFPVVTSEPLWRADLHKHVRMSEAANQLVKSRKAKSLKHAREALISALIDEHFDATCEAFWRDSIPAVARADRLQYDYTPYSAGVPSDFWRFEHAQDHDDSEGWVPRGSWGSWRQSRFVTEFSSTASTAALRFHDFSSLAHLGSQPVSLQFAALEVTVCTLDIERLIVRGGFNQLIRKVRARPGIRQGNARKSDKDRVIARMIAFLLVEYDVELGQGEIDVAFSKLMQDIATDVSADLIISDTTLRRFAAELVLQIDAERSIRSLYAPLR